MRRFVIGDIHGGHKALIQVLERAKFDKKNDLLICIGDVCDGWSEVPQCFETLLEITNLIYLIGNHDTWFISYCDESMKNTTEGEHWFQHGGQATFYAYKDKDEMRMRHYNFLHNIARRYVILDNKILLVHAGICDGIPMHQQTDYHLYWDRQFWKDARTGHKVGKDFEKIFIGHTPTTNYYIDEDPITTPMNFNNLWNVDTGAGWDGPLTMVNIDKPEEIYQSDIVRQLYPDEYGRNRTKFKDDYKD